MVTLSAHPVAAIFPLMEGAEYEALKADIAAHGLLEPIWLHEGKILDGRNRYRACSELGIEPETRTWPGNGSPFWFVVGQNYHRRHLNPSQKAMIGIRIAEELAAEAKQRHQEGSSRGGKAPRIGQPKDQRKAPQRIGEPSSENSHDGETAEHVARMVGTNRQYIHDAKRVTEADPELAEQVLAGTVTLPKAKRQIRRREKKAQLESKAAAAAQAAADRPEPGWSIITGDCIAEMGRMEPGSVRLIFADPPYNAGIDYGMGPAADRLQDSHYITWSHRWIEAAAQLLTPDGSLWVLISDEYAEHIALTLQGADLYRRQWLIWYESFGVNCANMFNRCSRHLFWSVKNRRNFVFHDEAVRRESARQREGDKRADPAGKVWDSVWGIDPPIPRLVENAAERLPDFPTQLPAALVRPIVGCASDPGDLVLDPFSGSGTTGAVCIELGRRFVGIEQSPTFADLSRMRLIAASHVKE